MPPLTAERKVPGQNPDSGPFCVVWNVYSMPARRVSCEFSSTVQIQAPNSVTCLVSECHMPCEDSLSWTWPLTLSRDKQQSLNGREKGNFDNAVLNLVLNPDFRAMRAQSKAIFVIGSGQGIRGTR